MNAPSPRIRILAASLIAWLGFAVHNAVELSPANLLTLDTVLPTAITAGCVLWWWFDRSPVATTAFLCWTSLNLVGGFVTVLPLEVLPFTPEQTVQHYTLHVVYVGAQVPLVVSLLLWLPHGVSPRPPRVWALRKTR